MSHNYYIIAKVDNETPKLPHSSYWPKLIAFSFENMSLIITEGRGHGLCGGEMLLSKFNQNQWKDVFKATKSEWFCDLIDKNSLLSLNAENLLSKYNLKTMKY